MTIEELDRRFAEHETRLRAIVAEFMGPTVKATEIMVAAEERAKQEREVYDKRAAEHDAHARAQQERAAAALDLKRRSVEAWERIALALERLAPFSSIFSSSLFQQPLSGPCLHGTTESRTDGRYCTACGQRVG